MSVADPFGLVGQVLDGQFRVDKLVGEGGFSAVYRGHHQGLNEPIAIKSLKLPSSLDPALVDTFVQRFRDESRILYRLSQGNLHVVRSIAAGTTQAPATGALVPYMVLEWLEGRSVQNDFTVRRTLGQTGRPLEEIIKLFDTAADGLAYAHGQGVAHRDLNPGNLFIATTQQGAKMKVLDFGVAKLMHEGALDMGPRQQTVGQIKIFAPAYGAPEQFDDRVGAVGAHSDVYAFALILMEALRDRCVNEGTHIGEFALSACDPMKRPTPRALGLDVPDEVEAAFARATTLDPKERWQSAGDFWQSLTIANKVAIERRHESAARETPPLTMGGPPVVGARLPPKDVAVVKNLARTIPLGSTTNALPRPGPAAPRPRTPTTIGIPAPATGARPPPAAAAATSAAPASQRTAAAPASGATRPLALPTPGAPFPAPLAPSAPTPPPRPRPVAAGPALGSHSVDPVGEDADEEEEATKVHAPTAEVLRTLAIHDAATARATADAMSAGVAAQHAATRVVASQGGSGDEASMLESAARAAGTKPPYVNPQQDIPEPPPSGGTLMMAPIALVPPPQPTQQSSAQRPPAGSLSSTMAMASPFVPGFAASGSPAAPPPSSELQDWQAPTHAQYAAPVQAAPGMQGIPGAHGTPPQGVPAVNLAPLMQGGGAPFGAPQPQAQQQHHPQQPGQTFGRPQADPGFAPQSYAPPAAASKPGLPVVPIAIGLAVLALGGIGLGVFALLARHRAPVDPAGSAMSSDVAPTASLTAVPVAVPAETATEPVPTAPPVVDEIDAAPTPSAAPEDAAPAVASATAVPSAITPTPPTPPPPNPPPFGQPGPTPPPAPVAVPPPTPSAKPAADPNAFSESTARARLGQANGVLAFCKKEGGATGPGTASVTFGSDGSVAGVAVDAPYAGTKEGDCVASQFRRAKVTPFTGAPQTVRHSFEVPK